MSKKIKAIIAASGVLLLLAVALVVLLLTAPDPNAVSSDAIIDDSNLTTLVDEDRNKTEYIEITNNDETYRLVSIGENLYGVEGFDDLTQIKNKISDTIIELCTVTATEIIAENSNNLQGFGLAVPEAKFTVKIKDKEAISLSVGNLSADEKLRYVCKTGDNTVYAVSATTFKNVYNLKNSYLETTVTQGFNPENPEEIPIINRILIERPDLPKPMIFEQITAADFTDNSVSQSGFWLTSPVKSLINETAAQDYIYGNFGITADTIECVNPTPEQLTEYGFDEPSSVFEIDYSDNLTLRVKTGNGVPCEHGEDEDLTGHKHENTHYYAMSKNNNLIYKVKTESMKWMKMQPKDILSTFAVLPSVFDVETLEFTIDGEKHELKYGVELNENDAKSVVSATLDGEDIDSLEARAMYRLLASTYIIDVNTQEITVDPSITVKFHYNNGKSTDTIDLYELADRTGIVSLNGNKAFVGRVGIHDKIRKEFKNFQEGKTVDTDW